MARASSIWLVFDGAASLPMATFTVKHEMKRWIKNNCEPENVRVFRYPDGPRLDRGVTQLDTAELFS